MDFGENYMNSLLGTVHVFEKNRQLCKRSQEIENLEAFEWENLENTLTKKDDIEIISYEQANNYFRGTDLSEYKDKIVTTVNKKWIFTCFVCLGSPDVVPEFRDDYDLLFLIAKCPYDTQNEKHAVMLRSVYSFLIPCRDDTYVWENIGFQSDSPWTDLRGVGMFGVLQMLYLVSHCSGLTEFLYRSSTNVHNTFPFAAASLNMTRITLNVLRHGKLNKDINERGVFNSANECYAAIFYAFGRKWVDEGKTISDLGVMLKDLETSSFRRKSRRTMLKSLGEILHSDM